MVFDGLAEVIRVPADVGLVSAPTGNSPCVDNCQSARRNMRCNHEKKSVKNGKFLKIPLFNMPQKPSALGKRAKSRKEYNIQKQKSEQKEKEKMKFSKEKLFEIAVEEYCAAGLNADSIVREGIGQWAFYSADQEYENGDEVRRELRDLIRQEWEEMNDCREIED